MLSGFSFSCYDENMTMMKLMQLSRPPFYTHVTQERSLSRRRYLNEVELTRSLNKMQFRVYQ